MTFDSRDVLSHNNTTHTQIKLTTGDCVHVDGEGPVVVSPSVQLNNSFLIPNSPCKLFSISQLTKELNCIVS